MKPKITKNDPPPRGGKTRPSDAKLDPVLSDAYRDVQPPGFKDHPRSSIEAADLDVDDTIGAE
jgi:hypothetical protein